MITDVEFFNDPKLAKAWREELSSELLKLRLQILENESPINNPQAYAASDPNVAYGFAQGYAAYAKKFKGEQINLTEMILRDPTKRPSTYGTKKKPKEE